MTWHWLENELPRPYEKCLLVTTFNDVAFGYWNGQKICVDDNYYEELCNKYLLAYIYEDEIMEDAKRETYFRDNLLISNR